MLSSEIQSTIAYTRAALKMLLQVKVSSEQEIKVKVVNLQTCLKATVCKTREKRKNVMEVVPYILPFQEDNIF